MSTVYPVVITSGTYANAAALTAVDASLLRNGSTAYVTDLGMFALNAGSITAPNNVTIIAATPNGNWLLQTFPYIMIDANNQFDSSQSAPGTLFSGVFDDPDPNANILYLREVPSATALASAGKVNLFTGSGTKQYRLNSLQISLGGTNFSGGSGDRLLAITDGTSVYSVIPAATLQTQVNAQWGVTALPNPVSAGISTATAAGASLYLQYSGGTLDYTAGAIIVTCTVVRVA